MDKLIPNKDKCVNKRMLKAVTLKIKLIIFLILCVRIKIRLN